MINHNLYTTSDDAWFMGK